MSKKRCTYAACLTRCRNIKDVDKRTDCTHACFDAYFKCLFGDILDNVPYLLRKAGVDIKRLNLPAILERQANRHIKLLRKELRPTRRVAGKKSV